MAMQLLLAWLGGFALRGCAALALSAALCCNNELNYSDIIIKGETT
ncbi:MAG: hypothetical protein RSC96_03700 [Oscillospiraceae bacterium]